MSKKYKVIVKVGNDNFKSWKVNNLIKFTDFLDREHKEWRWFNVFNYVKGGKGDQIANFTKNNRPVSAYVRL